MWPGVKEGWGLTLDPENRVLYATDGSAFITKIDADTLQQIDHYQVTKDGKAQDKLNELEWVDGYIWANVFFFNGMVKIDPNSGYIQEEVDFEDLYNAEMGLVESLGQSVGYDHKNNLCNGIAYDPAEKAYYVTGKRWNMMFKIRLDRDKAGQNEADPAIE